MDKKTFIQKEIEINKLDSQLSESLRPEKGKIVKGRYPYIPYAEYNGEEEIIFNIFSTLMGLEEKLYWIRGHEIKKFKFLDVGAGTGRIVKLAKIFGFDACGVEYISEYVEMGKKAYNLSNDELQLKDAFDLDIEFIKQFDFIYTYMPISDHNKMSELNISLACKSNLDVIFAEMLPMYYPVQNLMNTNKNFSMSTNRYSPIRSCIYFPLNSYFNTENTKLKTKWL